MLHRHWFLRIFARSFGSHRKRPRDLALLLFLLGSIDCRVSSVLHMLAWWCWLARSSCFFVLFSAGSVQFCVEVEAEQEEVFQFQFSESIASVRPPEMKNDPIDFYHFSIFIECLDLTRSASAPSNQTATMAMIKQRKIFIFLNDCFYCQLMDMAWLFIPFSARPLLPQNARKMEHLRHQL